MNANKEEVATSYYIGNLNQSLDYDITITKKVVHKRVEKVFKRVVDIFGALFGILLLIPITMVIKLFNIKYKDSGPIFYVQKRIGKDGKIFKMYKFRSMVIGADEKLYKYLEEDEEAREEYKEYKKLKNDPRITKVGSFLRKTSLDEFPQFINVLKGEMSLVGPRPYLPREKDDMGEMYKTIITMKPGITGYWQTVGRSDVTFKDRLEMDKEYYINESLKLDVSLLFKTVKSVIKKEGAM